MAQINSYKIVDDPKSNDRILAYRTSSGETVQIPFSALLDFLPTTLINLTDTPGTYIGQQGKTLSVNNSEDAMEFVPCFILKRVVSLPREASKFSFWNL